MPEDRPPRLAAGGGVRGWRDALAVYRRPRVVAMLFLGFSAGLPFLLIFSTLSAWLREVGVAPGAIGFFSWLGIAFSIKVLWAPVVDRTRLPLLTRLLGRRRSWMLLAQLGIAAGLLGIAASEPARELTTVALFGLLIAFASATQDIAIDAYRIEAMEVEAQGAMAATYQLGYRLALLAAGAGALYLADWFSWQTAYAAMAGLVAVGAATVLAVREPEASRAVEVDRGEFEASGFLRRHLRRGTRLERLSAWLYGAVLCPFLDFFRRNGRSALLILAFIGLYRLSDIVMGVMANPFYIDLGFTKSEIASVAKVFGFGASVAGAFAGGVLVVRYGVMRPLLLGAVLIAATNLLFALLAWTGPDLRLLALAIAADNLTAGIAGSVFIAYLSSLTNAAYTATQYALFSSLMTLPGKFAGGFSGLVVEAAGYAQFFVYAALLGVPAILLTLGLMRARPGR